jgi:hypothetical protein
LYPANWPEQIGMGDKPRKRQATRGIHLGVATDKGDELPFSFARARQFQLLQPDMFEGREQVENTTCSRNSSLSD